MKHIPILFSTPMVKAILEGNKTITRRVIKPQPDENGVSYMQNPPIDWEEIYKEVWKPWKFDTEEGESKQIFCPYGEPGDILWVRETYRLSNATIGSKYFYKADDNGAVDLNGTWKPSIFIPKSACRIFLKVKSIRVERLKDISDKDAIAEGVEHVIDKITGYCGYDYLSNQYNLMVTPAYGFRTLWEKLNGADSWKANPWVWVVEFERCDKPKTF